MSAQVITGLFTLVTAVVGFVGIYYTQQQQLQREQAQRKREQEREHYVDARALRDAKRERLREAYAPLLAAAWAMNDVPIEDKFGYEGETPDRKKERLEEWHQRTRKDVDECLLRLALERDATEVHDIFRTLRRKYDEWRAVRNISDDPRDADWNSLRQLEAEIHTLVGRLEATAREQLAQLEQPLPALPSSTSPSPRRRSEGKPPSVQRSGPERNGTGRP